MQRLTHQEILGWLKETRPAALEQLYAQADQVRRTHVGDAVHLRGLIEISNYCVRQCLYCGLRAARSTPRYRMNAEEILLVRPQGRRVRLWLGGDAVRRGLRH